MVITVKKDKSVKIALDSKKLNKAIHKNKYQMQSIDHQMQSIDHLVLMRLHYTLPRGKIPQGHSGSKKNRPQVCV